MKNKERIKKPIKLIIEKSKETVDFADFVNEIIDFEEDRDLGVNKPPSENSCNFVGKN